MASKLKLILDVFYALFSRVAPKATSTLLFIILMHQASPTTAGAFSLAGVFFSSAVLFSSFGLDELIVRETAQNPMQSRLHLFSWLFLRTLLSLVSYGIVSIVICLIPQYDAWLRQIILLQCLGLLPQGLNETLIAVFNANHKFKWMALVAGCTSLFQLTAGAVGLYKGIDLGGLILLLLCGNLLGLITSLFLSCRLLATSDSQSATMRRAQLPHWRLNGVLCWQQLRAAWPFAIIIVLVSLDMQIDVVMIPMWRSVEEVSIYTAARSLVFLLALLPQAFRMTVYPSMAKAFATSRSELGKIYEQSWWYLSLVGFPIVAGGMMVSPHLIRLVYRDVSPTAPLTLSILMLYLFVDFMYIPCTRLMVASGNQHRLSWLMGISLLINLFASIVLVPWLGVIGTAICRVAASGFYFVATEFYVWHHILPGHGGFRQAVNAGLSTIGMVVVLWFVRAQPLYVTVPIGCIVYSLIMILLKKYHSLSQSRSYSKNTDSQKLRPKLPNTTKGV